MSDFIPEKFIGKKPIRSETKNAFFIEPPKNRFHELPLVNATEEQLQKICKICHHTACPFCEDWCDNIIDEEMCCDGKCTY